jgi:hypothetical protein
MNDAATNSAYVMAEWIRRPLSDLDGMAPADAVNDHAARGKLDDLLTELAGHYVRLTHLGLPAVDPGEIRKALGMEARHHAAPRHPHRVVRPGPVKRNALLDELGTALTGGDVDSVSFFNSRAGSVEHFMHNLGDQESARITEAETNAELQKITPVTTEVRYSIMSDFISTVEDINVAGRLRSAISGKGAFRRFREAVDEDDAMRRRWLAYRTKRHYHLALDWLSKIGANFEQFDIKPADYDWEPPAAAPQPEPPKTEEAAQPKAEQTVATEAPADTPTDAPAESAEQPAPAPEETPVEA